MSVKADKKNSPSPCYTRKFLHARVLQQQCITFYFNDLSYVGTLPMYTYIAESSIINTHTYTLHHCCTISNLLQGVSFLMLAYKYNLTSLSLLNAAQGRCRCRRKLTLRSPKTERIRHTLFAFGFYHLSFFILSTFFVVLRKTHRRCVVARAFAVVLC